MPRPKCCRKVSGQPACKLFKPMGVPASSVEEAVLSLDEYEAIRLADYEGLYQEEAAGRMGVSRQTFGRTIEAARGKVALALVLGLVLRIEVPEAEAAQLPTVRAFACAACAHSWTEPFGTGRPDACPACGSENFRRKGCHGASACGPATKDTNA
ncbi:MAG: DUF134 domain-containing protein [Humidesulfovibrio sp.]|uniref:DUF134 domain-containing protein n=1 Tax=Humidesulfovibrio sp. TaxID=2910988 RepID=UPI0027E919B0|nr:DUF134 domain-containing protein [Humidesulfovibrio sp.]MDQ7834588.1 DUF134 domain-containing protein [Humidesulfovibrio sp.]